jgi:hypothetical protein
MSHRKLLLPPLKWRGLVLYYSIIISIFSMYARAGAQGDPRLLDMVIAANQANRSRIVTWSGRATIAEDGRLPGDGRYTLDDQVSFFVDAKQGLERWRFSIVNVKTFSDGKWRDTPDQLQQIDEMIRPDGYFTLQNGLIRQGQVQRTLVIEPPDKKLRDMHPNLYSFEPFWFMSIEGHSVPDELDGRRKQWDNIASMGDIACAQQQSIIELRVGDDTVENKYRFDLDQGGNLIEFSAKSPKRTARIKIDYQQNNGIWTPKTWTREEQPAKFERHIKFVDCKLNIPVDASEFTIEKMGVVPGTQISDNRVGLLYKYGGRN